MKGKKHDLFQNAGRFLILLAALVFFSLFPFLGLDPLDTERVTLMHLPVLIASVRYGPAAGCVTGLIWSALYFLRFGVHASDVQPAEMLLRLAIPVAVGAVSGWLFRISRNSHLRNAFRSAAAAAIGSALYFFMLALSTVLRPSAGHLRTTFWIIMMTGFALALAIVPIAVSLLKRNETVLGIDIGGSSTKLALIRNGKCVRTLHADKGEDLVSAVERIGSGGVTRIAMTGVGASSYGRNFLDLPVRHVDEFLALANGAAACSRKQNFLCVSIGTGTSFVRVTPFEYRHFGGSGMGGGTLRSMAATLCGTTDMEGFRSLADLGDLSGADLQLKDICEGEVPDLLPTSTVSNLGKAGSTTTREDMAAGICNLIFESIGVMAAFSVKSCLTRTIVLTGTITEWQIANRSLVEVSSLHHVNFIVPEHSKFAGAIGAALTD